MRVRETSGFRTVYFNEMAIFMEAGLSYERFLRGIVAK